MGETLSREALPFSMLAGAMRPFCFGRWTAHVGCRGKSPWRRTAESEMKKADRPPQTVDTPWLSLC
jgi:hypothetical protein